MAEDIKSLTKKNADLEKRLKFTEAKIKVIADSMTSPKDIEKYLDVLEAKMEKDMKKGIQLSEKSLARELEVSEKLTDANDKQREKEYEADRQRYRKENEKYRKEMEQVSKDAIRQAEFISLTGRVIRLEAIVAGLTK